MTELDPSSRPLRPEFRNINAFKDLPGYRWPLAAMVSGMHRFSGLLMFVLLPFIVWLFDTSLSSEYSHARFSALFNVGISWNWASLFYWNFDEPIVITIPGWFFKLLALALIWAYLHHFIAGLRHIRMDIAHHAVSKEAGRRSAIVTLTLSLGLTVVLGAKLFGLY